MQNRLDKIQSKLKERHDPQLSVEQLNAQEERYAELKTQKPLQGKKDVDVSESLALLKIDDGIVLAKITEVTEKSLEAEYKAIKHNLRHHSHDAVSQMINSRAGLFNNTCLSEKRA